MHPIHMRRQSVANVCVCIEKRDEREKERERERDVYGQIIIIHNITWRWRWSNDLGIRRSYIISPKTFILTLKRIKNKKTHEKCEEISAFINQNWKNSPSLVYGSHNLQCGFVCECKCTGCSCMVSAYES